MYLVKDELEVLNPTVASRDPMTSNTQTEADRLNAIKNELLDAILGGDEHILEAQRVTLEGVTEGLEELWEKMPYGKKDWTVLVKSYFTKKLTEKGVRQPRHSSTQPPGGEVLLGLAAVVGGVRGLSQHDPISS